MTTLRRAHLRDFQSIEDVEVKFDRFTVLVGPSDSGKSAFLRGMKACVRNSSVPANVRQGTKALTSTIEFDDTEVEVKRGKGLSTYVLNGDPFTKSGRSVPEDVEKALQMPLVEGLDLTFRFQFDKPPLLSETGSTAAQVLGSLTNVSLLHAAAREANRRKLETSSTLKVRQKDVVALQARVQEFKDLPGRKRALDAARVLVAEIRESSDESAELRRLVDTLRRAEDVVAGIDVTPPVDVSSLLDEVERLLTQRTALEAVVKKIRSTVQSAQETATEAKSLKSQVEELEAEYDRMLAESGCPLCGCPDPSSHQAS